MREFGCQETKLHRIKEIALAGSIAAHDGVGGRREGLDFRLLLEGAKVTYSNLLDMHLSFALHNNKRRYYYCYK